MQASSDFELQTNGTGRSADNSAQSASTNGHVQNGHATNGNGHVQNGRRQRIALFTGAYNHIEDGVSLTLNRLVEHLESTGAEVLVLAPTIDDPPIRHRGTLVPVPSFTMPGRPEYRLSFRLPRSVVKRLAAFKPTLFHIATPDYLGFRAVRLAEKWGVPVVTSFHTHFGSYLKYYKLGIIEPLLWQWGRWFYSRCRQIYVPSLAIAQLLRRQGIETEVKLWPRGVDSSLFHPGRRSLEWRRSLGIGDEEIVIGFVSRLVWEKGLDVFIQSLQALKVQRVPHRCLIVGDGPARSTLEKRLPDAIFTGYQRGEELARSYASADVFFFPSETETFGNVTLEAMASGLPTVCADAAGSNTLVLHGRTGYLAGPRDTAEFVYRLRRLIEDGALRRQLGLAALNASAEYSWKNVMARMSRYFDEVLDENIPVTETQEPVAQPAVVGREQPVSVSL